MVPPLLLSRDCFCPVGRQIFHVFLKEPFSFHAIRGPVKRLRPVFQVGQNIICNIAVVINYISFCKALFGPEIFYRGSKIVLLFLLQGETGFSIVISSGFLSERNPMKEGCRMILSFVQLENFTSQVNSGFTHSRCFFVGRIGNRNLFYFYFFKFFQGFFLQFFTEPCSYTPVYISSSSSFTQQSNELNALDFLSEGMYPQIIISCR
jgi:hypothetical protein